MSPIDLLAFLEHTDISGVSDGRKSSHAATQPYSDKVPPSSELRTLVPVRRGVVVQVSGREKLILSKS